MTWIPSLLMLPLLLVSVQGIEYPPSDFIFMVGGDHWGFWGETEVCANGSYVYGLEIKVEPDQGSFTDDSALNEIRLFCRTPEGDHTGEVTSTAGDKGIFTGAHHCPGGFMNGFDFKVEAEHNRGDNTAANGIRAYCTGSNTDYLEPPGAEWGEWLAETQFPPGPAKCHSNMVVCGIMTLVQEDQGRHDDTALNDVKFLCCHLPE